MNGRAERAEAGDALAGLERVEQAGAVTPTRLAEDAIAGRRAGAVAQDLEDRERPAEQRIEAAARLDHHELSGLGAARPHRARRA